MIRVDTPAPGLRIAQPNRGFRYGAEAFWVAGFALEGRRPGERTVLDVGTGSGIIAGLLARHDFDTTGIDVQPEWLPLWAESRRHSAVPLDLHVADVRTWVGHTYDVVVSNPPFFAATGGPASPDPFKAAARTELHGTLAQLLTAAMTCVAPGGRLCLVVPIEREADVRGLGLGIRRAVQVGRRRWLAEVVRGEVSSPTVRLAETDPRVEGWAAAARA